MADSSMFSRISFFFFAAAWALDDTGRDLRLPARDAAADVGAVPSSRALSFSSGDSNRVGGVSNWLIDVQGLQDYKW